MVLLAKGATIIAFLLCSLTSSFSLSLSIFASLSLSVSLSAFSIISLLSIPTQAQAHTHKDHTESESSSASDSLSRSDTKHNAKHLLSTMKKVLGREKMRMAFANGVFADGVLDILHDISGKRITSNLAQGYGEMNIRVLLFWARVYAMSAEQFQRTQKTLLELKDIEKCIQIAIEHNNEAHKTQLMAMFDYAVNDNQNSMADILKNMIDISAADDHHHHDNEDGDAHAHSHSHVHVHGHGLGYDNDDVAAVDINQLDTGFIKYKSIYDDYEEHQYSLMKDEWMQSTPRTCGFIDHLSDGGFGGGSQLPYFISAGLLDECWVYGKQFQLIKYIQHQMRWDFHLLHDRNVMHAQFGGDDDTRRRRRRRRRSLLDAGQYTDSAARDLCTVDIIPDCKLMFEISVADAEFASFVASFSIDLLSLEIEIESNTLPYVDVSTTLVKFYSPQLWDDALFAMNHSEYRSFVVDFNDGHVVLKTADTHHQHSSSGSGGGTTGNPDSFDDIVGVHLLDLAIDFNAIEMHAKEYEYVINIRMSCFPGSGALMKRAKQFSKYEIDPAVVPVSDGVLVPTHINSKWYRFIAGELRMVDAHDEGRSDMIFFGEFMNVNVNTQQSSASAITNVRPQPFFVIYRAPVSIDGRIWITTHKWVSPGYDAGAYVWKLGLFSLHTDQPQFEWGIEYYNKETGVVDRITLNTVNERFIGDSVHAQKIGSDGVIPSGNPNITNTIQQQRIATPFDLTLLGDAGGIPEGEPSSFELLSGYLSQNPVWPYTSSYYDDPAVVKEFQLILDISGKERGILSLNASWDYQPGNASYPAIVREIPLFELEMNCTQFAFRPIVAGQSTGSGTLIVDQNMPAAAAWPAAETTRVKDLLDYWSVVGNELSFDADIHIQANPKLTQSHVVAYTDLPNGVDFGVGVNGSLFNDGYDTRLNPVLLYAKHAHLASDPTNTIIPLTLELSFNQTGTAEIRQNRVNYNAKCFIGLQDKHFRYAPSDVLVNDNYEKLLISPHIKEFTVSFDLIRMGAGVTAVVAANLQLHIMDENADDGGIGGGTGIQHQTNVVWISPTAAEFPFENMNVVSNLFTFLCEEQHPWMEGNEILLIKRKVYFYGDRTF